MHQPTFGQTRPEAVSITGNEDILHPFQPLPPPTGKSPFHLDIKDVLPAALYNRIITTKQMTFQAAGDVGGVKNPADQQLVATHMEAQFDKANPQQDPAFLYIPGDVVYYYGKRSDYNSQFYEPYKFYPAPIFAIPGNHDGDVDPTDNPKPSSLEAFVRFFCSAKPVLPPEAGDAVRKTMIQPNVYWTLVTPVANIIGLYTNVPSGGVVADDQKKWFINELVTAGKEKDKALIVTLHHPPYSMDHDHGASIPMQQLLDDAFTQSKVFPDMVFTGHVHNYQRFTRAIGSRQVPYIVAGAGGYWFLHNINTGGTVINTPVASPFAHVTFEKYCEDRHGFLRLHIDMHSRQLTVEFFTVPRIHESWKAPAVLFDHFTLDLVNHKIV